MKETVFVLLFSLVVVFGGQAQQKGPIDLILLLDTSSSMSASYGEVSDYISGPFLREFLRLGDTFHLISFSERPRVEIVRRVEGRGEVETIIGRMLLMYPLDPWSDIPGALAYAEKYIGSLPPSRPKKLVLVSDGDVNPAPGSGSTALNAGGFQTLINDTKTRLSRQGVTLDHVTAPLAQLPVSGRSPLPQGGLPAEAPGPGTQAQSAAASPGGAGTAAPAPGASAQTPRSGAAQTAGAAPPAEGQSGSPAQTGRPPAAAPQTPSAAQSGSPAQGNPPAASPPDQPSAQTGRPPSPPVTDRPPSDAQPAPAQTRPAAGAAAPSAPVAEQPARTGSSRPAAGSREPPPRLNILEKFPLPIIGFGLLALAVIGGGVFFIRWRLKDSSNRQRIKAAGQPPRMAGANRSMAAPQTAPRPRTPPSPSAGTVLPVRRPPYEDRYKGPPVPTDGRPLMLKLFVADQNTLIGKRNIHLVKQGINFTIGGGKSDFLIFLVPLPPHIADLRYVDNHCTIFPRNGPFPLRFLALTPDRNFPLIDLKFREFRPLIGDHVLRGGADLPAVPNRGIFF